MDGEIEGQKAIVAQVGRSVAEQSLPSEIRMLSVVDVKNMAGALQMDSHPVDATSLVQPLVDAFLPLLAEPQGENVESALLGKVDEQEIRWKAELYWRCVVALFRMPLPAIRQLSKTFSSQKPTELQDPGTELLAYIKAIVPEYSQVAKRKKEATKETEATEKQSKAADGPTNKRGKTTKPANPLSESKPVANNSTAPENATAADHTYDKGYKKWVSRTDTGYSMQLT